MAGIEEFDQETETGNPAERTNGWVRQVGYFETFLMIIPSVHVFAVRCSIYVVTKSSLLGKGVSKKYHQR